MDAYVSMGVNLQYKMELVSPGPFRPERGGYLLRGVTCCIFICSYTTGAAYKVGSSVDMVQLQTRSPIKRSSHREKGGHFGYILGCNG